LFTLQPIVSVSQALMLGLRLTQIGSQLLDQVQQPPDQFPGVFVLDGIQVKVVQHSRQS
jgi:hypothetical protein